MSIQAKVGAFSIAGLILMMSMFFGLSDLKLGNSDFYRLNVGFSQAIGLNPGAAVCYAGVQVGSVEAIDLQPDKVLVHMKIRSDVKVPRNSHFSITADGVMGENFVNIQPISGADLTELYADGETVDGSAQVSMETVMDGVNKTLIQVQNLLTAMNELIGDEAFKLSVHDMAANMKDVTANLNTMTAAMANMAVHSQSDIEEMAHNLNVMTASLMRSAANIEQMVTAFNGDGETGENLKVAIRNLSATSARIDKMATALEGVVTDPQVAEDLKATLHNVRGVSERADKMLGTVSSIQVTPGVEAMYSGKKGRYDHNWMANMDVTIASGEEKDNSYLKLGVTDIGEGNRMDALAGMRSGSFGGHAGVIENKAGIGADLYLGDSVTLSVDGYDPNDFRLKSRLSYEMAPDTFLFTQVNDINNSDDRTAFVGLRREF